MAMRKDPSRASVGIIGVGIMGFAYARNLVAAGFAVSGFDVDPDRLDALESAGGTPAESPRQLAESSDVILLALPSVDALSAACLGPDGIVAGAHKGTIVAEMGTLPLSAKEECRAALEAAGAAVLDCPVSGTGAQAEQRDLVLYASGEEAVVDKARPVFDGFARETRYVGAFGAGIKLKYVANLLVTIHNLAAAEALLLAEKAGLDLPLVYDAISAGAGTSRMFEVRGPLMIEGRYEPATMKFDVYQKDISLIVDFARELECPIPLMTASLPYYEAALAQGRAKEDTAGLFAVLKDMASKGETAS